MRHLSDSAIRRLRGDAPNLCGSRYRLIEEVARGGMGVVYAAEDEYLQRRVAVKMPEGPASDHELANRLTREARVLARLEHPGIVPVHDVGTSTDGRVFYVMKYVDGQRLDEYIASLSQISDRLRTFLRVCDAVGFAHSRGVIHRDLKPSNVMVGPFGEVLVVDWGLAKILATPDEPHLAGPAPSDAGQTGKGSVMGTPGYMSPEQSSGEVESLDARSDIYALGAVLRFVVAPLKLDRPLEAICAKACSGSREDRYASAQELAADVSRYLDGLAVHAHREGLPQKAWRFYRRYRPVIWLILAYLLMRTLLLIFLHR